MTVFSYLRQLADSWRSYRQCRAAMHHLTLMDDRLLADIGVRRDEIADFVQGRGRFVDSATLTTTPKTAPAPRQTAPQPVEDLPLAA